MIAELAEWVQLYGRIPHDMTHCKLRTKICVRKKAEDGHNYRWVDDRWVLCVGSENIVDMDAEPRFVRIDMSLLPASWILNRKIEEARCAVESFRQAHPKLVGHIAAFPAAAMSDQSFPYHLGGGYGVISPQH